MAEFPTGEVPGPGARRAAWGGRGQALRRSLRRIRDGQRQLWDAYLGALDVSEPVPQPLRWRHDGRHHRLVGDVLPPSG